MHKNPVVSAANPLDLAPSERLQLWMEMLDLQHRYVHALDNDQLEDWPAFFVEEGRYDVIPKENEDAQLPVGVLYCRNAAMMRDRVVSLRNANIYEAHSYRHAIGGLVITAVEGNVVSTHCSYIVVNTGSAGESTVYQAGCYIDRVVKRDGEWKFLSKRVVFDTLRVQTLLATPI